MIGVIDTTTLLAGYIDPNSPIYAVYSTKLPGFYANGSDPGPQGLSDEGPPVYTNGIVYALESIETAGDISAGTTIYAGSSITANTFIVADTSGSAGANVSAGTTMYVGKGVTTVMGQNRVNKVTYVSTSGPAGSSSNINCTLSQVYDISMVLTDASGTYGLNVLGSTPVGIPGAIIYLNIVNIGANTLSVIFGDGFRERTSPPYLTLFTNQRASVTFVSEGNSFFEVCRTPPIS
jgi:hypothetical protein